MTKLVIFLLALVCVAAMWHGAGLMQISYPTDPDVQQTEYKKPCDSIVQRYFGGKDKATLKADSYLEMIRELRICGERVETPVARSD